MSKQENILTIDVEDLDATNLLPRDDPRRHNLPSRVCGNMDVLLDVLAAHDARATMFFLGTVAERHPQLVRRAQAAGHEIASHGYAHELVYSQTRSQFHDDVKKSVEILQAITGSPLRGYRAPSWSISKDTPWAYEVLVELGFEYDASLFPFHTFLYGDSQAPVSTFVRMVGNRSLYEVPASVVTICGRRIPFGGGFYLRAMPYFVTRWATFLTNRSGRPAMFYIHPREIDPDQPRFDLPWRDRFIAYANLGTTLRKLEKVLCLGPTISIQEHLRTYQNA